ncbi:CRISPR-associated helicase/endonuclease Cas3, partial [Bacillus wiedmannii]
LNRVRDKQLRGFDVTQQFFFKHVMKEKDFHEYVNKATVELESYLLKESPENAEKQLMFLTKFIFSTLIDADRTNTRLFEEEKSVESVINS